MEENKTTIQTERPQRRPEEFFHISIDMLADRQIFPFQLYVYNPMNNRYSLFLHGNNPLIKDKFQLLNYILERGGGIAVLLDQKKTFLSSLDKNEEDIPSLSKNKGKKESVVNLIRSQEAAVRALNEKNENKKFYFKEEILHSILDGNFINLIDQAREELGAFKVTLSHTVSLARYLALDLLYEDNFCNQVAALCYHLAKGMGVADQPTLANIVCAAFLYHLGDTQLDFEILKKPHINLNDEERKKFRQHPGLTQHLLKKIALDLDPRSLNAILDHHERVDGSGYPSFKRNNFIDPLSLCLGAVSHIMEYHHGRVNGVKTPLKSVILNLKNKASVPGLEFQFGDLINQNLMHLINLESLKKLEEERERELEAQKKAA